MHFLRPVLPLSLALVVACAKPAPAPVVPELPALAPGQVYQSPNDDRQYRTLVLDNGVKVLLIHDADTDLGAAAVDAHLGQFADPPDRQGLTHFLEHMLFMGTDAYPDVDEYRKFITDHGGGSNAGTGAEHTTYHFDIDQEFLEPALDRFARFFIAPKLDPEYVERERNAVHSEYSLKLKDEFRRNREVMRATGNPAHPYAKFSVGNLDTLEDTPDNPLWDDLKAHYDSHYGAGILAVGVIGREDLDTLERWVVDRFAAVPDNGYRARPATVPPFLPDQLGVRVNITPLADSRVLELHFPAPASEPHFREHPVSAITTLLGHEGKGSLFALLKSKGWIEALSAGSEGSEDYTLLTVSIRLTEAGYAHIDAITDLCFQQIRLIEKEGLVPWRHQQSARLAELKFRYADEQSPASAARMARNLQTYPPEHVLNWWATWGDFDKELVQTFLGAMRPENMRMVVIGPDLETDRVEPLYQVPYGSAPIPAEALAHWRTSPIDPELRLPPPNPFIPEDTSLEPAEADAGAPVELDAGEGIELWHHTDVSFGVPETMTQIELFLPEASADRTAQVSNVLLAALIDDSFEEFAYPPRQAGLTFDSGANARGFRLSIGGYDDKQPEILDKLVGRVRAFTVDPERFAVEQARIVREWRNTVTARPMSQASWELNEILDPMDYDYLEGADRIEALTAEQLQAYADRFLAGATARILVHGNTSEAGALAVAGAVRGALLTEEQAPRPAVEIRKLPQEGRLVRDVAIDHDDSVFLAQYQGRTTELGEVARYMMLGQVLKTPFFSELRTKQQLGYSCHAYFTRSDDVPGLRFAIQSASAGPVTLEQRVDAFVADYHGVLAAMPDQEYQTIRDGLVADLTKKELRLGERNGRYRWELALGMTEFDSREQLVAAIEQVSRDELVAFYAERLLPAGAGRLIVRSFGHAHGADDPFEPGCADTECVTKQMPERFSRRY